MPLTVGTRLGYYEVTGQLGVGGMGEVYRARDTKLGREVAIKTLPSALAKDPDRLARFEREAKLLAALNHAHIGAIYGLDEHEGTQFIAMELVEGQTLEERLKDGALPIDDALRIALQISEALEAAHEKGVIHRDLKPANIMLTRDGVVKVLDFGLAKAFSGDPNEASPAHSPALSMAMTQQGLILGTAGYMSPEQASGQATDQRADVWAFGVVLYEMLTGFPLFSGESVPHILADVLRSEPDWTRLPENLHPRLKLLLERCLKKRVRDRTHSMADVRIEIAEALQTPEGAIAPPATVATAQPFWRRAVPIAVGAVVTATVAGLAGWSLQPLKELASVRRFVDTLPSNHVYRRTGRPVLAVSPDSSAFAYNTAAGLYLRRFDDADAQLIPGTEEDLSDPFFSPDGASIAYYAFATGQLKRIGVDGGASVAIASDVLNLFGASWNGDGSILFGQPDGIYRVPASGGAPARVIAARDGEQVYGPELLPDGDSVLFSVAPRGVGRWDSGQIVVESLSTGERQGLIDGGSDGRYSPTGHIVYAFKDRLFAVGFDAKSRAVTSAPAPLLGGVARTSAGQTGAAQFGVSDNGTLIYMKAGSVGSRQMPVWVDRMGQEEPIPIADSAYQDPSLSPDGRLVLTDRSAEHSLWIWDFETRVQSRLLVGGIGGEWPVWNPDGTRIAYHPSGSDTIAWIAANSAEGPQLLAEDLAFANDVPPAPYFFSLDGKQLIFGGNAALGNRGDIGVIDVGQENEPRWLLDGPYYEGDATLSADGRFMAYVSDQSGQPQIFVRPFPNVETNVNQISDAGGIKPRWSRDGSELYYLETMPGRLPRLMAVSVDTRGAQFSFRDRKPIMDWPYIADGPRNFVYDVSVNGKRFLAIGVTVNQETAAQIGIVENWFDELERLVPTH